MRGRAARSASFVMPYGEIGRGSVSSGVGIRLGVAVDRRRRREHDAHAGGRAASKTRCVASRLRRT